MNLMEKFPKLMDILLKYGHTLGYGVLTGLTAGGELIFSTTVFKCPCHPTWNLPYGLVFLLVPALALFLLGYWMSTRARLLMTGCCQRANSQGCCLWVNNQGCCTLCCQCCDNFLKMSTVSIVAPLTWVAVALLGGNYYECFASGIPYLARRICVRHTKNCSMILPELPCLRDKEPDLRGLLSKLQAQSQVAGWVLIAVVIILLMIISSWSTCQSPFSFMQLKFRDIYKEQELECFTNEAKRIATEMADMNVKCFFEDSHPGHRKLPTTKDWQQISQLYNFKSEKQYYTMLHKYVNEKKKSKYDLIEEEGSMETPIQAMGMKNIRAFPSGTMG
ncbi:PREDICTED: protein FAM26F-like [Condylura cristata]|uniref:protein FAM26F-like n=1 Tax=Condylura cristata TaxID=143302 RepID=UPI000642D53D|nr:PREDICTED: protein FAM26F-like [Condylura cristata]